MVNEALYGRPLVSTWGRLGGGQEFSPVASGIHSHNGVMMVASFLIMGSVTDDGKQDLLSRPYYIATASNQSQSQFINGTHFLCFKKKARFSFKSVRPYEMNSTVLLDIIGYFSGTKTNTHRMLFWWVKTGTFKYNFFSIATDSRCRYAFKCSLTALAGVINSLIPHAKLLLLVLITAFIIRVGVTEHSLYPKDIESLNSVREKAALIKECVGNGKEE